VAEPTVIPLGFEAKAYVGAELLADVPGTGSWTEFSRVKNIAVGDERGEYDATTRANGGFTQHRPTLRTPSIEFECPWDPDDAGFAAIRAAYQAGEPLAMAFMSGDCTEAGSTGIAGNWCVMKFARQENLSEELIAQVSLKPHSWTADWDISQ
jgi:hypothetical protein